MHTVKLKFLILLFILIVSNNVKATDVKFDNTQISIKIIDKDRFSDVYSVQIQNEPQYDPDTKLFLKYGGGTAEILNNMQLTIDDLNLISESQSLSIILKSGIKSVELFKREIPSASYNHLKHIYVNWTFGSSPPKDGRGFGIGAIIDSRLLESYFSTNENTLEVATSNAEEILNLLLGNATDYNGDDKSIIPSDGFGLLNYAIGMRDHINNAGINHPNSSSSIAIEASKIVKEFANVVEVGDVSATLSKIESSNTMIGVLYNNAKKVALLNSITNLTTAYSDLKISALNLTNFLRDNYNYFRSVAFDIDVTINQVITINNKTNSNISESSKNSNSNSLPFNFSILFIIAVPVIRKLKNN